jgi:hypothetical protein
VSMVDEQLLDNENQLLNQILDIFDKHSFLNLKWKSLDKKKLLVKVPIQISRDQLISGAWNLNKTLKWNSLNSLIMEELLRRYCVKIIIQFQTSYMNEGSYITHQNRCEELEAKWTRIIRAQELKHLFKFVATVNHLGLDKTPDQSSEVEIGL